jgi:CRP-like cAMP-binding protein
LTLESDEGTVAAELSIKPGSVAGLPATAGNTPYSMSSTAKRGATVGFVTRNNFSSLMLREPQLGLMILRVLAAEVSSTRPAISSKV